MLGYVKIDKGELKVREYEVYTGYYCGICKSIGKRYGQLPRMALSYDAAFLAVLLASLSEESDMPVQEHCIAHPFIQKKTVIRNRAVDYAGDVMLILAWYKLADDASDDGKVYAKATMKLLGRIFRKLHRRYPALCNGIEHRLERLSALEKEKCASIDMAAEEFSGIMELIFSEGFTAVYGDGDLSENTGQTARNSGSGSAGDAHASDDNPKTDSDTRQAGNHEDAPGDLFAPPSDQRELFARIGYHMGKWIYLIDAVDDIEENIGAGTYNPLLYRFSYDAASDDPESFRCRIEPDLRFNLYHYLAVLSNYTDSLDIRKNKGIIDNVIYLGLNRKTEEIISRIEKDKQI